jgi:hypothetical protein
MDYVYAQFAAIYPGKWNAYFRTEIEVQVWRDTWARGFEARLLTQEQVRSALDRLPDLYEEKPPTLGQFIAVCMATKPEGGDMAMLPLKRTEAEIQEGRRRSRIFSEQAEKFFKKKEM